MMSFWKVMIHMEYQTLFSEKKKKKKNLLKLKTNLFVKFEQLWWILMNSGLVVN